VELLRSSSRLLPNGKYEIDKCIDEIEFMTMRRPACVSWIYDKKKGCKLGIFSAHFLHFFTLSGKIPFLLETE
jgi:hypothetical protein